MKKILFVSLIISLAGCNQKKGDYELFFKDPFLYCRTVHELNTIVMGNNFTPIVASRNYLYAAVAGYEIMAAGYTDRFNSLAGQLHGLKAIPKTTPDKKINYDLAAILAYCKLGESVTFPAGSMKYWTDSIKQLALDHGMPTDILENTVQYSDTVSSLIMDWSKHDNYSASIFSGF